MKLYIWEGSHNPDIPVLRDYSDGMIVALANDLDEAHKVILNDCPYAVHQTVNGEEREYPIHPTTVIDLEDKTVGASAWLCWGGG